MTTDGRLHILHLITSTDVGGAEKQLLSLVQAGRNRPWRQRVVSLLPEGPVAEQLRQAGAEVSSLGMPGPSPAALRQGLGRLRAILRHERPQLMQTWMYHADLLGLLAARLPLRPAGALPVIWSLRCSDLRFSASTRLVVRACARLAFFTRAVVANSQAGLEFHAGLGYSRRRLMLIPNGFDTDLFRPDPELRQNARAELGLDDAHLAVVRVARDDPNKDLPTFLAALKIAAPRCPRARFVLIGQGMDPANPALAQCLEPPLKGVVRLLGLRQDVPRLLAGMDIFAQSSLSEGLPGALGEAMSSGLVCVATKVGDSQAMVGQTGFLVEPIQPLPLAQALIAALGLREEDRLRRGVLARARIEDGYSLAAMVGAHAGLYAKVVGAGMAPAPTKKAPPLK